MNKRPSYEEAVAALTAHGALYEMQETDVRGQSVRTFTNAPVNLNELYSQSLVHGDRTFIVFQEEGYSFAEIHKRARRLSDRLTTAYGLKKGDRVAIAMRNYPEWVISFMAVTMTELIVVPMNAWWTGEELAYGLEDSGASLLIADVERLTRVRPILDIPVILVRGQMEDRVSEFNAEVMLGDPEAILTAPGSDDDACIMYTSGTTGFPKGAVSTHRNVISTIMGFECHGALVAARNSPPRNIPEQPAILLGVPLFHVTGCNAVFLASFRSGRKLVMMYRWDSLAALGLIESEKITAITGVPSMVWDMLQQPTFDEFDTSTLASVGGGGAPSPPQQVQQIEEKFAGRPALGYGLTESSGAGAQIYGDDYISHPRSTGRPPLLLDIEAFDDNGHQLPRGEQGELRIRGPVVFRGYWNNPEATAEVIVDGWLCTGDIGRRDEEGFVYVEDRKKDMVLRGGENVYCAEVEAALYNIPGVHEAVVFGVPDTRLGEKVACAVVEKEGASLTDEEIRSALAEHIAHFKVPEYVAIQNEPLARNAAGKYLKREIRGGVLTGLGLKDE